MTEKELTPQEKIDLGNAVTKASLDHQMSDGHSLDLIAKKYNLDPIKLRRHIMWMNSGAMDGEKYPGMDLRVVFDKRKVL